MPLDEKYETIRKKHKKDNNKTQKQNNKRKYKL